MGLNKRVAEGLDSLEALYYITQGLFGEGGARITRARGILPTLGRSGRQEMLAGTKQDIAAVRKHYGALAPNRVYRQIVAEGRAASTGLVYLSKLRLERQLFSDYEQSMPRWPHIKSHAFVVFDPQGGWINQIFELDGQLFHDAQLLLGKARHVQGISARQRQLPPARQRLLQSLLRPLVMALFTFLEAYLNGLAFDCFQKHHDSLSAADHDLLGEWDSTKGRRRFVAFDQKIFRYPAVIGKAVGRQLDLSGLEAAHRIIQNGKDMRDAITHPSAHFDPSSRDQKKMQLFAGLTLSAMETLYRDASEYVLFVEQGLGHDATQTATWLFDDYGFTLAKEEAV